MRQVGLDAGGGGAGRPGAPHVPTVVAVMVMMMARRVMSVVVIVMVEVRRLRRRGGPGTIGPLLLLELAQPLIVALQLIAQQSVLLGGPLLVVLETADAVEAVQVDPAPPPHAHAVHDEMRAQVNLKHPRSAGRKRSVLMCPQRGKLVELGGCFWDASFGDGLWMVL